MNFRYTAVLAALAAFSLSASADEEGMKEKMSALIKESRATSVSAPREL